MILDGDTMTQTYRQTDIQSHRTYSNGQTEREKLREAQTERHTNKHTDKQTGEQTDGRILLTQPDDS